MQVNKQIQKNTVNEAEVHFSDVPKSGFSLGFSSQLSGTIGTLLPIATQWVMSGDRCSGGNSMDVQFEPLAVPMTGRLNLDSHNFYVRFRNIYGYDWTDFQNLVQGRQEIDSLPTFTLKQVMSYLDSKGFPRIVPYGPGAYGNFLGTVNAWLSTGVKALTDFTTEDWLIQYRDALKTVITAAPPSTEAEYKDRLKMIFYLVIDKILGEGSYMDYFGYPIIDHRTVNKLVDQYASAGSGGVEWYNVVTDIPLCGAPLRGFYYIWYCFYRNIYTEPKSKCINPRKWTMTALPIETLVKLMIPRFRNWNIDMFTGAQIDDISRHVYAGIPAVGKNWAFNSYYDNYSPVDVPDSSEYGAEGIISQDLQYLDSDGYSKTVTVRVPSIFGSAFLSDRMSVSDVEEYQFSSNFDSDAYPDVIVSPVSANLPLLQLRRAKYLEQYLKRVFFGGDLHRDYIKSVYGVDLSESISNIPEYLPGGSSTPCDVSMETNNTTTDFSPAGQKTAVMSANGSGDGFTKFCDEFGLIFNVISFLPECSYDPMPNQLLYSKLMDFPIPFFSQQDDELSHRFEISRTALKSEQVSALRPFAHHPYKHDWRGRVNDFHGNALSTRKMYNFGRLFDYTDESTTPKLNASFLHCKPNLDMFINSSPLNDVWFGYADHQFYVERALTAYVENL